MRKREYDLNMSPFELPYNERAWSPYDEAMKEAPLISSELDFTLKQEKKKCSCQGCSCNKQVEVKPDYAKYALLGLTAYFLLKGG